MKTLKKLAVITFFVQIFSCEKFVEVPTPVNEILGATVFESDETALSVLSGLYANLMKTGLTFGSGGITFCGGLSSDEFLNHSLSSNSAELLQNQIQSSNGTVKGIWGDIYYTIYTCNVILQSAQQSSKLSPVVQQQLIGESLFVRAFCNFYLVNLWGDAPLALSADYRESKDLKRTEKKIVEEQIVKDLKQAIDILTQEYPTQGRVRPNRWAAKALLARVYLYMESWEDAKKYSSELISASPLYELVTEPEDVFKAESKEAILQLLPIRPGYNTNEASSFLLSGIPQMVSIRESFANDFETGDKRRTTWVGEITLQNTVYYFPAKYKVNRSDVPVEYYVLLRLAEQYLIRAESEFRLNNISAGISDLNLIRNRAGISPLSAGLTSDECMLALMLERKRELFAEWGHRWLDLKRTGTADIVLPPIKPQWSATDKLYPIPQSEILLNTNLIQNPGY